MSRPLALVAALIVGCTGSGPGPDPVADADTDTGTAPEEEPIVPGTETVSTSWDVDLFSLYESPTIGRFDTLDGRRQLDGMTIAVDHAAVMTLNLENGSAFALAAEDYTFEFYLQSIIQLGVEEEPPAEGEEGPPFFGPGSFLAVVAVDLAAGDGDPSGGPDQYEETVTDGIEFEAHYDRVDTERYLDAMTGTDEIQLVVGGFSESWVYWNDDHGGEALLFAGASAIRYSGTMTVTYEYSQTGE